MQQNLRKLIQEFILEIEQETQQEIDEFSVTANVAGATTPLGTDAKYPNSKIGKKKRIRESDDVTQMPEVLPSENAFAYGSRYAALVTGFKNVRDAMAAGPEEHKKWTELYYLASQYAENNQSPNEPSIGWTGGLGGEKRTADMMSDIQRLNRGGW